MKAKAKSNVRFQQLNRLVDTIAVSLPSASHVAVALVCYRHAREDGVFGVSTNRIAKSTRLSKRQVQRVLDYLEKETVLKLMKEHQGPLPRKYKFTGRTANGDTHVTIKNSHPPN
jgi:hypothetical protein